MEIVIHRHNKDDLLRKHKVQWTLYTKKTVLTQILYACMGALVLILGILERKKVHNFWGFDSSVGLSLILLSLFYFTQTYRLKLKYFSELKQIIERFKKQAEGIEIIITDRSISYKDFETFYELKWSNFRQYKFYKDYLFLITGSTYMSSVIINKNEINADKFYELLNFVSKRIPEKF